MHREGKVKEESLKSLSAHSIKLFLITDLTQNREGAIIKPW